MEESKQLLLTIAAFTSALDLLLISSKTIAQGYCSSCQDFLTGVFSGFAFVFKLFLVYLVVFLVLYFLIGKRIKIKGVLILLGFSLLILLLIIGKAYL